MTRVYRLLQVSCSKTAILRLILKKTKKLSSWKGSAQGQMVSFGGMKLVRLWSRAFWESMKMSLDVKYIVEVKLKLAVRTVEHISI